MDTFLFDRVIYGPVSSRRLGISLGINLLPANRKFCNFDCSYCECGLNGEGSCLKITLPTRKEVSGNLQTALEFHSKKKEKLDVITFAGNGEPTMHPDFHLIINDVLLLRDKYYKDAAITVLSNSTMLHKKSVIGALKKVDNNIMKLDSGINETVQLINRPTGTFDIDKIVRQLKSFSGQLIIQTMFLKGFIEGKPVDNTTENELAAWEGCLREINPRMVMIYTIARNTPFDTLEKIPADKLKLIAARIEKNGISVKVSE
jgi:wyosine [tRNA(Phe)-imidazoG37] synthetase (radical SAM superfamily)